MFELSSFFVSTAHAAETAPAASGSVSGELMRFLPLFLIFLVFYFLLIRPQEQKIKQQEKMHASLKKGDKVFFSSGLVGTIAKLEGDSYVSIEIAKDVQIKALRSAVTGLVTEEGKPANSNKKES